MKALRLALPLFFLLSCSTLPGPNSPDVSLVIGTFSMSFPGKFFDTQHTVINSDIELDIRDVTAGRTFSKFLYNGHFAFLAQPGHTYELAGSRANMLDGSRRYILGWRPIGLKIEPSAGRVLSLGNVTMTYAAQKDTLAFRPEVDYELIAMGSSAEGTSPGAVGAHIKDDKYYDVSVSQAWDDAALQSYMKEQNPSSPWLSREIVDVNKPAAPSVTQ